MLHLKLLAFFRGEIRQPIVIWLMLFNMYIIYHDAYISFRQCDVHIHLIYKALHTNTFDIPEFYSKPYYNLPPRS